MKKKIIRVEPLSTWVDKWNVPASAVTRHLGFRSKSSISFRNQQGSESSAALSRCCSARNAFVAVFGRRASSRIWRHQIRTSRHGRHEKQVFV